MREILFRGKRINNGKWVEGAFLNDGDSAFYICPTVSDISYGDHGNRIRIGCWYKVEPSTVGQFTGLTDKNGKRIFEKDVVRFGDRVGYATYGMGCFCIHYAKGINCPAIDIVMCEFAVEVIGNIHDNPDLLDGGDGQ